MKQRILKFTRIAAVCGMAWLGTAPSLAQDMDAPAPMDMSPEKMLEMMVEASKPGEHHKLLNKMEGAWDAKMSFFMAPGAPPEVSETKVHSTLVMGGRCLMTKSEGEFNFAGQSVPMVGMGMMGYNRHTGEYQSAWMDTLDPYVLTQAGKMEDGVLTMTGKQYSDLGISDLKMVYRFEGDDAYVMELWSPAPEGMPAMPGMDDDGMYKIGMIEYARSDDKAEAKAEAWDAASQRFVYFIHPTDTSMIEEQPTPEQMAAIGKHFNYLRTLTDKGIVIMAGPTTEPPYTGIVVFEAPSMAEAEKIMKGDPAVEAGIFEARVAPFRMSLSRDGVEKDS